jgi:hypothetical protein
MAVEAKGNIEVDDTVFFTVTHTVLVEEPAMTAGFKVFEMMALM